MQTQWRDTEHGGWGLKADGAGELLRGAAQRRILQVSLEYRPGEDEKASQVTM